MRLLIFEGTVAELKEAGLLERFEGAPAGVSGEEPGEPLGPGPLEAEPLGHDVTRLLQEKSVPDELERNTRIVRALLGAGAECRPIIPGRRGKETDRLYGRLMLWPPRGRRECRGATLYWRLSTGHTHFRLNPEEAADIAGVAHAPGGSWGNQVIRFDLTDDRLDVWLELVRRVLKLDERPRLAD